MTRNNKYWLIFIIVLALGFFSGILLAPNLGFVPATEINTEESKTTGKDEGNQQAQDLMTQMCVAFEEAAAKVSPSVVPIFAEQVVQIQSRYGYPDDALRDFFGEDFLRRFFGKPEEEMKRRVRSMGSGVIVTKDGYILTNNHVVDRAEKLLVTIGEKKTYEAKVIGTDSQTDIAVIKVEANELSAATLGNSDKVRVGQWVIAVGNPFQLLHTVTAGIISAKGRSSVGLAAYEDFIQTDASINPGNSGGALADLNGHVIGINTAITSPSGGSIGIGFTVPINMAKQVMEELISKGRVIRGYIGITSQDISENLATALKLKGIDGVLVVDVVQNGPADRGGIERGDVIIEFNEKKIEDQIQLRNIVAQTKPQTSAKVILLRNAQKIETTVNLVERPRPEAEQAPQIEQPEEPTSQKFGLTIQTLTPDISRQLGYEHQYGVVVINVTSGSAAAEAGLQRRDLIKEINRKGIQTVQDFANEIRSHKSGDVVALLVRRGQAIFYLAMKIP